MPQTWRWKVYLTLFLALLSVYVLAPTFGSFNTLRETTAKNGEGGLPWYLKLFPEKEINLGLDLRGGIYLELEVTVEEAIGNRLDLIASEVNRYLKEEKVEGTQADRIPKTYRIRVLLPDRSAMEKLKDHVKDYYHGALVEDRSNSELVYQSSEKEEAKLQSLYSELSGQLSGKEAVLDVERSTGSDLFRLVLKTGASPDEVKSLISAKFPTLKETSEPNKIIFRALDNYIEKLRADSVKQAVETIRNRIDRYGVAEPSIRQLGENRVVVELPGVTDPERAISIVKQAGKLEFKLVDEADLSPNPDQNTALNDNKTLELVAQIRKDSNIPEGYNEEIVTKINEAAKGKIPAEDEIGFEVVRDPMTKKISGEKPYLLKRKAELTGDMLNSVQVGVDNKGPHVSMSLNPIGTRIFADLTTAYVHKRFAIILDGTINSAPVINEPIPSGNAQITMGRGGYDQTMQASQDLVLVLREGALPASLKEITKTVIGPSLGKSTIHKSLIAALIAGLTVVVFMMIYYKGSGLIADLVLGLNVLLIMGCLALFQATLTLPGIAGIVLTMGMALDANILIFERIREELKSGKPVKAAVDAGFSNAWSAVVDTHLTTFLSGLVLYEFGTGPIRGFAVTLMIGVMTTLFTAYWVTRFIYEYLTIKMKIQKVSI